MNGMTRTAAALALCLALQGCQETLYSGLSEADANLMRQALMQKGIDASKRVGEDGKHVLEIASADAVRAMQVLQAAGLPRNKFASTIEVLKTDALVASPAEDRARLGYALSQELASTLSSIDGVVTARVHLVMPDKPSLGLAKATPPSASVFIKHRPGYNLQASTLAVRQLVATGVEGLSPDNVSVVMWPTEHERPVDLSVGQRQDTVTGQTHHLALAVAVLVGLLGGLWLRGRRLLPAGGPSPTAPVAAALLDALQRGRRRDPAKPVV